MKKITEVEMAFSGALPETKPLSKREDYTDFYATVGLPEEKVLKIIKKLTDNFKADRKNIISGINGMENTDRKSVV
jgi:hypothetical protein